MRPARRTFFASCSAFSLVLVWASTALAAAGDVDPTFSGDGYAVTSITSGWDDIGKAVAVSNNKVVIVGNTSASSTGLNFAVARYNLDGSPDTTFSGDGKWSFDFPVRPDAAHTDDEALDVAIQSDGKIVVIGRNGSRVAIVRLTIAGAFDPTFSGDGRTTFLFASAGYSEAKGVAIQSDGKIVVAGYTFGTGFGPDFGVARVRGTDGVLDTTFSGDGLLTTDFSGGGDIANDVALQSDGKIVVIGQTSLSSDTDVALSRYTTQGTLDTTFSGDGKQITELNGVGDIREKMSSVALQSDGKIVVAGYRGTSTGAQFALARYTTNGGLDTSFSGDGLQYTYLATSSSIAYGFAVAIQSNGKIVVAGRALADVWDIAVARYNTGGGLDSTFSGDGKLVDPISSGSDEGLEDVAVAADGKIVGAGWTNVAGGYDFLVARYLAA